MKQEFITAALTIAVLVLLVVMALCSDSRKMYEMNAGVKRPHTHVLPKE